MSFHMRVIPGAVAALMAAVGLSAQPASADRNAILRVVLDTLMVDAGHNSPTGKVVLDVDSVTIKLPASDRAAARGQIDSVARVTSNRVVIGQSKDHRRECVDQRNPPCRFVSSDATVESIIVIDKFEVVGDSALVLFHSTGRTQYSVLGTWFRRGQITLARKNLEWVITSFVQSIT